MKNSTIPSLPRLSQFYDTASTQSPDNVNVTSAPTVPRIGTKPLTVNLPKHVAEALYQKTGDPKYLKPIDISNDRNRLADSVSETANTPSPCRVDNGNSCTGNARKPFVSVGDVIKSVVNNTTNTIDAASTPHRPSLSEVESQRPQESWTERQMSIEKSRLKDIGINVNPINTCIRRGMNAPEPKDLFKGLWYEGELCCLYADTNVGKSILALQIADHVSRMGLKVLYVDLEMNDKGLSRRCGDADGNKYVFDDNLLRLDIDSRRLSLSMEDTKYDDEEYMFNKIVTACRVHQVKVLIIDNITALCSKIEEGGSAIEYVKRLLNIRDENGWSILVLAHTPKLDKTQPITRDSLAGSKRFISLIDSAFAIGEVSGQPHMRYIKQTKVRMSECVYNENNVLVCSIEYRNGLLQFVEHGTDVESKLIKPQRGTSEDIKLKIFELHRDGASVRQIADMLNRSKSTVQRVLADMDDDDGNIPRLDV